MFKRMKLSEIGTIVAGGTPKTKIEEYWNGDIAWITPKDLSSYENRYISKGERKISQFGLENSSAKILPPGSILFTSRAPIGYIAIAENELTTNQGFKNIVVNKDNYNIFIYYLLKNNINYIKSLGNGSTFMEISGSVMKNIELMIPSFYEQKEIAKILSTLDEKIEVNNQINKTLENMAQAIFKQWFVDFEFPNEEGEPFQSSGGEMIETEHGTIPKGWEVKSADMISKISIGKTPPRKESKWFSLEEKDIRWISIKDLGNSGLYILKSNEYLTKEAIEKFNINVVPDDTVVLSFKMTIGRLAITVGEMATNEAIAHFSIFKKESISTEYLYLYLKQFDYNSLGNTSSIATAINSKIVKKIPILVPNQNTITTFNITIKNIFRKIKIMNIETSKLINIRDIILPKLMSGEIRVPQNLKNEIS